ncbi:hypothetical protein BJ138DRAFT_1010038, partial [Hygrophoropsis aurantiaca]
CLQGTRVEVLNCISSWIETEGSQPICWLNGLAGSGKSAIAQRVAETYYEKKQLAASFFFSRREMQRSTTRHFFPTLSSQIQKFFPSTKRIIAAALDEDDTVPTKFLHKQMQALVLGPLCAMTERPASPVLLVVDSLDECDNELVVELITLLAQLIRQCPHPFRLLFTSRIESHIQDTFREPSILSMTLTLRLANFDAEKDIRSFMAHAFDAIYKKHHMIVDGVRQPWPSTEELEKLMEKTSGLFIFATTVIKFIDSKHQDPRARLHKILDDAHLRSGDTIFTDLDILYQDAIRTISDVDLAQLVLGVVRHVSNPLSIRALNRILSPLHIINVAHTFLDLGSVLLVPEDLKDEKQPVRIYHASFSDFLSSPHRAKCYFVDPSVYHPLLARLCLEHMCGTLKRDICDIGDPSKLNSEVDDLFQRCSERIDEVTRYACLQWSYHLTQVPTTAAIDENLRKFLVEFSRKSILHWVETLSLLGAMDSVITMLRDAISWLKVRIC